MKIKCFYRNLLPLLLALFNVIGSTLYSYNSPVRDLDPKNFEYLQEDQNTSALYIQETSARCLGPVFSTKDLVSGNYLISENGLNNRSDSNNLKLTSIITRDHKKILKTYIFPFHFFW